MTAKEIMLRFIRAAVFGCEIDQDEIKTIRDSLDEKTLEELYDLSSSHNIAQVVGYCLSEYSLASDESAVTKRLLKTRFKAAFRADKIMKETALICDTLEDAEIEHIALKGAVMRGLYPKPWMRTSCDVDVLVREADLDRAVQVLVDKLGYTAENKRAYHDISLYSPDNKVHLELHFSIKENMDKIDSALSRAWEYTVSVAEKKYERRFTDEFFLFHLLAHTLYHFIKGGCGVRSLIDIKLFKDNVVVDQKGLNALLKECGIEKFSRACDDLGRVWFESAPATELMQNMDDYVISGRVYGTVSNAVAMTRAKKGGETSYFLSRVFLPRNKLSAIYPILNERGYLTPVCQVARWFTVFDKKKSHKIKREMQINASLEDDRIIRAQRLLEELEL